MKEVIENLIDTVQTQSKMIDLAHERIDLAHERIDSLKKLVEKQQELLIMLSNLR